MDRLELSDLSRLYYRYRRDVGVPELWLDADWAYVRWDSLIYYAPEPHGLIAMHEDDI